MSTVLTELAGFRPGSGRYMKLHVASKLAIPLSISLCIVFTKTPLEALALVAASAVVLRAAGIPLSCVKRYVVVIASLSSFVALSLFLFTYVPGRILLRVSLLRVEAEKGVLEWSLCVTDTALSLAALLVLRILAMVLSAALLLGTVTDRDLVWGLRSMGLPFGVCIAASLFFRGIQLFVADFHTVREAMMARGLDFARTPLHKRFTLYASALIPLISLMITRSYEVSLALESRGISPGARARASYHRYRLGRLDAAALAVAASLLAAYAAWWFL